MRENSKTSTTTRTSRTHLACTPAHADEKWRCAKATVSQLQVDSSLRLQLKVDCCIRFAQPMIYSISSVQDCATRGAAKPQLPVPSSVAPLPCSSQFKVSGSHPLRKKRGQSVSDGMSRASLSVFAVNSEAPILAVLSPSGDFGCGPATAGAWGGGGAGHSQCPHKA